MNTDDIARLDYDEKELAEVVIAFVRLFRRLPSGVELSQFGPAGSTNEPGSRRMATLQDPRAS